MIHAVRIFTLVCALAFMASCGRTSDTHTLTTQYGSESENSDLTLPTAPPRGVNLDFIQGDLDRLILQADILENQIEAMTARLTSLREHIRTVGRESDETLRPVKPEPVHAQNRLKPRNILPQLPDSQKSEKPARAGKGVVALRTGRHSDRTRIVLDVNGSTAHTANYDREAGLVTVSLTKTAWAADKNAGVFSWPQLKGYQAKNEGDGAIVALSVDQTSRVKTETIKGQGNQPARLVIDLYK